jgi:hypothetical protein
VEIFEATEHKHFIKNVVYYLILHKENKSNTVVIHGAANAGKTQFLNRMAAIFTCARYKQTRGNFDCRYKGGRHAPHFVICEEGCLAKLFDPRDKY